MADAPNAPSTTPTNSSGIHPKVFIGTLAGAVTIIAVWALGYAKIQVPPEVASAITTIIGGLAGYFTPGGSSS